MSAHKLIERLDSPRQTARDSWIARCPAHADKRPSLAVRALDDGRTLIHCFAGCGTDAVLGAIGLTVSDLFPPKPTEYSKRQPPKGPHPSDALRCLSGESLLVLAAADLLAKGDALNAADSQRLALAARRIRAACEVAHV